MSIIKRLPTLTEALKFICFMIVAGMGFYLFLIELSNQGGW